MVAYDVQAHPFNRAPSASPQVVTNSNRYPVPSDTDGATGSGRSSVWSVEIEHGSCGCISGYFKSPVYQSIDYRLWYLWFGRGRERNDTLSGG